jgi:probable dihydroxyacetone kinase regulator
MGKTMSNALNSETTKRLLVQSLKKLMASKPLSKITIREIADDSGVNRQTFYYHFQDIYDLVRWMYQEEAIALVKGHEGVLLWQEGILQLFRYIEENKEICLNTLNSLGHQHIKRLFYEDIHAVIEKTFYSIMDGIPNIPEDYAEFLIHYYSIALAAVMESWLRGGIKQTPEQLIEFVDITINDHIRGGLQRIGSKAQHWNQY